MKTAYGRQEIFPADVPVTSDGILNEKIFIYIFSVWRIEFSSDLLEPKACGVLLMPNVGNL